jgi:hypothetical protein
MKLHIFKYTCLSVVLLAVASCINTEYGIQAPLVNAVSNLQYTQNGDSAKFTWTLPQTSSKLTAILQYNGSSITVNGNNPTSYTFGVVQTNVPYMFTVKLVDASGNMSLGQSVKFTRAGVNPVTNLQVSQDGSNSVLLTWVLPTETLSGITVKLGPNTVTLPGTATSYEFDNLALGSYLFGIVATAQSQISNTVYATCKVGPTVVAYLGTDADSLHISDHEQAAAAKWLFANYPAARYISFAQIQSGAVNLSQFDVVWWNYDIENGLTLPAIATNATVLASINSYFQNGGKLLCSCYAINYLWNLGRLPNDGLHAIVENDSGNGGYNGDVWTVNIDIDGKQDNSTHPLFKGITTTTQGDGEKVFPVIGAGWKENHNCVLAGVPNFFGLPNNNDAAYSDFCNNYTAKWLAGWGGISDYFTAGIFELDPTSTYKGTALAIGIGGIEWDQLNATGTASMVNPYQANVISLYTNAISYLKSK